MKRQLPNARFRELSNGHALGFLGKCLLGLLSSLALCSCSRQDTSEASSEPEANAEIVARIGNEIISKADFEAEWTKRRFGSTTEADINQRRQQLLASMIQTKAALVRARDSGFDQNPEVVTAVDQLIAHRYLDQAFSNELESEAPVSTEEARIYYQANLDKYRTAPAVRVGVIKIASSPRASAAKREDIRNTANRLRTQLEESTESEFTQSVQDRSDDQSTRYIGGDAGWLSQETPFNHWNAEVVEAAFNLQSSGEMAPLIECADAFYIVRLKERRVAGRQAFEEVEAVIRHELAQAKLHNQQAQAHHTLTNGLIIEINRTALDTFGRESPEPLHAPPSLPGS